LKKKPLGLGALFEDAGIAQFGNQTGSGKKRGGKPHKYAYQERKNEQSTGPIQPDQNIVVNVL